MEKKVDGYSTRYVYDGPQVLGEYDGNNNLLRQYIYGPGMKQIRNPKPATRDNIKFKFPSVKNRKSVGVADANAVYYYHFDAPFDYAFGSAQGFG